MLHQIGSGVLGPVFRTYEPQHDRLVAVKAFRLDVVPEDIERLAVELRRLVDARVTHPGIVPALDAGLEGGVAYLAMEYIAGETLDVAFRHLAPALLPRALPILSTIAGAIDAAWAAGFGHGALHPRDVFFRAGSDEVSVTGFGVVPALETIGSKPPARRPYAAPERAAGGPATHRADVYSLGAIAHELLTRRRPGTAGEQDGALATGVSESHRDAVGRVLSTVLAADPADRYPTAQAFVDALAAIDDRSTVAAVPTPGPLFDHIEESESRAGSKDPASIDDAASDVPSPQFDTMAIRRQNVGGPSDLQLTPVNVRANWEAALDPTPMPEPVPAPIQEPLIAAPPSPVPPVPDLKFDVATERPSMAARAKEAREKEWEKRVAAEDAAGPATVSRDRRPLPPALFASVGTEAPAVAPFPWAAVIAAGIACLTLGGVGGYQLGLRARPPMVVTPPPAPAATTAPPSTTAPAVETPKPPPPVSEPAPAPTGRLAVRSVPTGALITIDGKSRGAAPQTIADLPLGTYTLQVARPGYAPKSQQIVLTNDAPSKDVTVTLERASAGRTGASTATSTTAKTGVLIVDTLPKGATVTVDGRSIGATPARANAIAVGSHTVRITLAGYKPVTARVTIKAGVTERLTRSLERTGG